MATELQAKGCHIHDYYFSDIEHGMQGAFQEFKATPKENYELILALLKERG